VFRGGRVCLKALPDETAPISSLERKTDRQGSQKKKKAGGTIVGDPLYVGSLREEGEAETGSDEKYSRGLMIQTTKIGKKKKQGEAR